MTAAPDPGEREVLRLLLEANLSSGRPVSDDLVAQAFELGERHALDPTEQPLVTALAHAIERAAGA